MPDVNASRARATSGAPHGQTGCRNMLSADRCSNTIQNRLPLGGIDSFGAPEVADIVARMHELGGRELYRGPRCRRETCCHFGELRGQCDWCDEKVEPKGRADRLAERADVDDASVPVEGRGRHAAGKSLIVVEVDYAPGVASPPHRHAGSAYIYAYVLSGEIESKVDTARRASTRPARVGPRRPARSIRSAATRARPRPQSCWRVRRQLRRQEAHHTNQINRMILINEEQGRLQPGVDHSPRDYRKRSVAGHRRPREV